MKTLGLDVSSISTGYSIMNNGRLSKVSCGIIKTNPRKQYGERLLSFEKQLKDLIRKHKPDNIIIEDIFKGRNIKTFKSLAMFRGIAIKVVYEETGKNPISIMASEARSIIGVKNKKEITFEFIVDKYNLSDYNFEDHNDIVDSIALALSAHIMKKQGIDEKFIHNARTKKRRKRKRNKTGV